MIQRKLVSDMIKRSYPHVNLAFGTFASNRLPELLYLFLKNGKRVFELRET